MAPSFPGTGDCVYYVVQNKIPFIQMRTWIQRSHDYVAARIRSFLTGDGQRRAWCSTPKQSVTLRRTSFLLVKPAHTVWISRHRSIVFLPVLPVSARKGAWAQRMGRASPRPLGLGAVGGITLNVSIMSRAALEGQTFKRCSVASS